MKLDRNINTDGRGKYALLKLRRQEKPVSLEATTAATTLKDAGLLHFGNEGPGEQFFVMKYKDVFTAPALRAYAKAVRNKVAELRNQACQRTPDRVQSLRIQQQAISLENYAMEIEREAEAAAEQGVKLPD